MKRIFVIVLASAATVGLVIGQGQLTIGGNHWQRYWGWPTNAPPPLTLSDAYSLALADVGQTANRFYCVAASTLEMTNYHFRGWAFTFADTNGQRARVEVSFDRELRTDPRSRMILHQSAR